MWWMNEITSQQLFIEASSERGALSWPVNPQTQLLTYPSMLADTAVIGGAREIDATSTRFIQPPPQPPKTPKKVEEKAFQMLTNQEYTLGARRRAESNKKVDLDNLLAPGTTSVSETSLDVNGFDFVQDPSSTPTKHDPIITWGEIEGTPLLLDPTDTPISIGGGDGSGFKMPQTPKRDQIGLDLVDKVKARQRQSLPKSSTGTLSRTTDVPTPRSEAGQRLADKLSKRTQKGLDHQLRASYNSPLIRSATGSGPKTPTPTSKSRGTPSKAATPTPSHQTAGHGSTTPTPEKHKTRNIQPKVASLTDNLLNL